MSGTRSPEQVLIDVATFATAAIPGAEGAGVTVTSGALGNGDHQVAVGVDGSGPRTSTSGVRGLMAMTSIGGGAAAVIHTFMSLPIRPDAGFSHAVRENESDPLCGADAVSGEVDWPELGQPWPAGPSRCSACAQLMSASRRG